MVRDLARANHGTLNGAPVWRGGRLLCRNTTPDWVSVPDSPSLRSMTALTMQVRFWYRGPQGGSDWNCLLMKGYYGNNGYGFLVQDVGILRMYIPGVGTLDSPPNPFVTDQFYDVVGTCGPTRTSIYINGREVAVGTGGTVTATADVLGFAREGTSAAYPANLDLEVVRIWARALTAGEVAWLYADPYGMFTASWQVFGTPSVAGEQFLVVPPAAALRLRGRWAGWAKSQPVPVAWEKRVRK
jgi:hypothetical protein